MLVLVAGCQASRQPTGMVAFETQRSSLAPDLDEVARVDPGVGRRALLVVFPRSACSGSARTVFMDPSGTFLGAVGPGEGALLSIPEALPKVLAASSVEVGASVGSWFYVDEVVVPPAPDGIVLASTRRDARHCGSGHYADVTLASKSELEAVLGEHRLRWLSPDVREGQAWLDAHAHRVAELVGRKPAVRPTVVTRTYVP